jgi:hypothetical protein
VAPILDLEGVVWLNRCEWWELFHILDTAPRDQYAVIDDGVYPVRKRCLDYGLYIQIRSMRLTILDGDLTQDREGIGLLRELPQHFNLVLGSLEWRLPRHRLFSGLLGGLDSLGVESLLLGHGLGLILLGLGGGIIPDLLCRSTRRRNRLLERIDLLAGKRSGCQYIQAGPLALIREFLFYAGLLAGSHERRLAPVVSGDVAPEFRFCEGPLDLVLAY